jgi:hypothetical protein
MFFDGLSGADGYPQFQGYVTDYTDTLRYVNEGDLYYNTDHTYAFFEVYTGNQSGCPDSTDGWPYQNFGTDYDSDWDSQGAGKVLIHLPDLG